VLCVRQKSVGVAKSLRLVAAQQVCIHRVSTSCVVCVLHMLYHVSAGSSVLSGTFPGRWQASIEARIMFAFPVHDGWCQRQLR
jgi:hypothetical protein